MNKADAVARVTLLGAAASRPALTQDEVEAIVGRHAMADGNHYEPGHTSWVETYDVNAATAEVFRIKAGRVAGDFNFSADDASFSKGDVLAHLLEMETKYAQMAGSADGVTPSNGLGTIQVTGTNGPFDVVDKIAREVIP